MRRSEDLRRPPTRYASQRLAYAIVAGSRAAHDLKTLSAWGREVGASAATLRAWCYTVREQPKRTLDFVRVLRAVTMWQGTPWDPFEALDIVAPQTLRRLLSRGSAEFLLASQMTPSREMFVKRQQYLSNEALIEAILGNLSTKI